MLSFTLYSCGIAVCDRQIVLAVKCLQHLSKCQLFDIIKGLHHYTVSVYHFALSCLYFVCRLNAPVIVDCRKDGDSPSVDLVVVFFPSW